ncbi:putative leucine-rich repeat domain superfamily [Dioscorea sansibarensis]
MKMERRRNRREGKENEEKGEMKVDLSGMSLSSFPSTCLNLASITKLDLSNNNLQSIPESLTARLLNIIVLDVHSNQLNSIPNSIGCLSKLKSLDVSGNLLDSLPITIENCRALEELNVNFNKLTRLPDTMGFELMNLKILRVNSNKLAFLPFSTSHMTNLRILDAHLNCLRSLPDGLENLINLEVLNISQNFQFLQTIPYSIGLLMSLTELDISYNKITVLPDSISCLTKLKKFSAEGNQLVCPPVTVVAKGVDAVRDYMGARMKKAFKSNGRASKSWFGRLVKCGAFDGQMVRQNEGLLALEYEREYHSFDGTPSRLIGKFSPLRLFSPKRFSSPQR